MPQLQWRTKSLWQSVTAPDMASWSAALSLPTSTLVASLPSPAWFP
jgi:hypothetical protein